MERPGWVPIESIFTEIKGGMKSHAAKIELPDGTSYIIKQIKKTYENPKKANRKADKLKKQYETLKTYLGPYIVDTDFRVEPTESGHYAVYVVQKFLDGSISFKEGLSKARETGELQHFKDFLLRFPIMYSETQTSPDITGNRHMIGWRWQQLETTENVLVVNGKDGLLMPILVDVGFISGEPIIMKQVHNWKLKRSSRRLLKSLG